jgi:hypothetical protein
VLTAREDGSAVTYDGASGRTEKDCTKGGIAEERTGMPF